MTDRTTAGIEAEPEEVEALLHNLCGFHLAERDPVARYTVLTREQVLYDALVAAIKRERGRALAELAGRGHRLTEVAALTGLRTRQQVQRLIQVGAARQTSGDQGVDGVQEASRQFEERLAAVEATLDAVVSGIVNEGIETTGEPVEDVEALVAKEPGPGKHLSDPREPSVPVVPGGATFDPLTGDIDELTGMMETTQVVPALTAARHVIRDLPADDPWRPRTPDPDAT